MAKTDQKPTRNSHSGKMPEERKIDPITETPMKNEQKPRTGSSGSGIGHAELKIDLLEPRILLSASWVEADTDQETDEATSGNDVFRGDALDDAALGIGGNDPLFGEPGDDLLSGDGETGLDARDDVEIATYDLDRDYFDYDNIGDTVSGAESGVTVTGIYAQGSTENLLAGKPELETLSSHHYFEHGSLGHTGYNYVGGHDWFSEQGLSTSQLRNGVVTFSDGTVGLIGAASDGVDRPSGGESAYLYYRAYDVEATNLLTMAEDTTLDFDSRVLLNNDVDSDSPVDTLSVVSVQDAQHGTVDLTDDGRIMFTPDGDYRGSATFTYTVEDDGGHQDTATVTIGVMANEAPVVDAGSDQVVSEGDQVQLSVTASDADGQTLTYTWTQTGGPEVELSDPHGEAPTFRAPEAAEDTDVTFEVSVHDGMATTTETVAIRVQADNDATDARDDIEIMTYDLNHDYFDYDNIGDTAPGAEAGVTVTGIYAQGSTENLLAGKPELETLSSHHYFEHGSLGHTGYNYVGGHDWFSEQGLSTSQLRNSVVTFSDGTVGLIGAASNGVDRPSGGENAYLYYRAYDVEATNLLTMAEDTTLDFDSRALLNNDVDSDSPVDTLSVVSVQDAQHGTVDLTDAGQVVFTPDDSFSGSATFTYTVEDDGGNQDTATVTIAVLPVNDGPNAIDDAITTREDTTVTTGDVLANDTDLDGDTLTVDSFTQPEHGTVTYNGDGTFDFTPDANYHGTDRFAYTVSDGSGATDTASIDLTIDPVNDAPVVDAGADLSVTEGEFVTLSTSASDLDGDQLTYTWEQTSGTLVHLDNADTAHPAFVAPYLMGNEQLEFQVTVSDGEHFIVDTVFVNVEADNDPPTLDVGADQTVSGGAMVTLDAQASVAPASIDLAATSVLSYGGASQDVDVDVSIDDDGNTLGLTGNGWKAIDFPYTVTEDTILEFDFKSGSEGEIHGIGFDNDNQLNANTTFKIHGTQNWGIADHDNYDGVKGEWQHYSIRVGDHFTGDFDRLTFAMDHDIPGADGESLFSNIRVYEEGQGDPESESITYTWEQISGPEVSLSDPHAQSPVFQSPEGHLNSQEIEFQVTVSDGVHEVSETVTVTVEGSPDSLLVDAGQDLNVQENETVTLGVSTETGIHPLNLHDTPVASYGGASQDIDAVVTISDDGDTIELAGNGWKAIDFPYTVTEDTILEFDFKSGSEGEIHGIGFDNDNQLNAETTFKVHGTQNWGIGDHDNYDGSQGEWQHYTIRVGDHFTGDFDRLTFAMDHDVADANGESFFSNIRVYEDGQTDTSGDGLTYAWRQVSGPPVTLQDANTDSPTFIAPNLGSTGEAVFEVAVSNGETTEIDTVAVTIHATNRLPLEPVDHERIDWSDNTDLRLLDPESDDHQANTLLETTHELLDIASGSPTDTHLALDDGGRITAGSGHEEISLSDLDEAPSATYRLIPVEKQGAGEGEVAPLDLDEMSVGETHEWNGGEPEEARAVIAGGLPSYLWGLLRGIAGTRNEENKDEGFHTRPSGRR